MAMVVTCGSCGARFRVKEALLKDAAGARIRCRRCGGHIDVWKPGVFPVPPAPVAPARNPDGPAFPPVPEGAETEPEIAPAEAPGPGPAAEPEQGPHAATRVPAGEEEPAEAKAGVPVFDLTASVPVPAPEPGFSREPREVDRNALRRESRLSRRRSRARFAVYLVAACVLLLAGGAFFLRDTQPGKALTDKLRNTVPGRELVRRIFPPPEPAKTAVPAIPVAPVPAEEKPAYDIRGMDSSYMKAYDGVDLFLIQGTVANVGKGPSRGIRIHAALLGKDNQALVSNAVFAGNLVDNTTLRHASRAVIEGLLGARYGEGNANRDIPAGKSLPFMAVFFDPPGQFESYTVKALDAE